MLSWSRWVGIILKEFIQLKRDRLTFGMVIGIPVMQLILFGYAINTDPKRLPTAVLAADASPYSRSLVSGMQTSGYFRLDYMVANVEELDALLASGRVHIGVTIPEGFVREVKRVMQEYWLSSAGRGRCGSRRRRRRPPPCSGPRR